MRPELERVLEDLPGLAAILERTAARYVRLGRVGGTVEVEAGERRTVERLGSRVDARGRVKLADLDQAFRGSRLAASLPEVLADFRRRPLVTRSEARRREDDAWRGVLDGVRALDPPGWAWAWIESDEASLRADWRRLEGSGQVGAGPADGAGDVTGGNPASWSGALQRAFRAAGALEETSATLELPRLAYRVCGDAHGLDADQAAGRLFERLLLHHHRDVGLSLPLSAEDRENLYALAGLTIDELSSTVHVAGLEGPAPLVAAARAGRHVLALPLRTLYELGNGLDAHGGTVFAVENRSVLSALHRELRAVEPHRYPTLVCTSGHVSLAALRLLDQLSGRGAVVRYSGDFDARGLMIADAMARRLGPSFQPWRMSRDAFERALAARRSQHRIDPGRLSPGAMLRFPDLARAVETHGAAFQEGLLVELVEDVLAWVRAGAPPP